MRLLALPLNLVYSGLTKQWRRSIAKIEPDESFRITAKLSLAYLKPNIYSLTKKRLLKALTSW